MKPLLGPTFPELFVDSVTPKAQEAIVDRPHKLATAPKGDAHFRHKIGEAFRETRRILKEDGRLLLMFGHKKLKAWDAILTELIGAGFTPIASWPIHTERKAKFRHGHIAALSTSCLIVCIPRQIVPTGSTTWKNFLLEVKPLVKSCSERCKESHLYGSDMLSATVAPLVSKFKEYDWIADGGKTLTIADFLNGSPI